MNINIIINKLWKMGTNCMNFHLGLNNKQQENAMCLSRIFKLFKSLKDQSMLNIKFIMYINFLAFFISVQICLVLRVIKSMLFRNMKRNMLKLLGEVVGLTFFQSNVKGMD